MSGVQKGHRRKSSTVSAAVLRGITQNDTSSFNLRQGPENPSGTGETSISRADEGARSYGVTDPQSSGPGSCCSSPPPRSSSGSISQATSHNLSNNGSQYANAKAEYDGQMRQRCNEGNGVVKNEVDESPPWLDNASGKGNGVPTSQSTERKPNSCCGSNLANSSAVSDTTAPGYTLEGLRRSALQSAPPVGSSNGNITSSGDAWASPMAGQLGMHATGLNYLSSPDLGLLGQTPATLSATPFMLPPGYETSQYPTVSENAAFSHQTPNLFAFSTPQQQSSPLDKSMHTPGWMSPSVAQSCGCGDACNCLGCATHPYNNRMIEYARHIRQLTEDDPLVWDNLSRPQSIVGQSSSDLTAFQPLDAVSYYTPPNAVGAEPMGDLGSGWQTEPLGATALTPQALDNVGHKAFSMSSDDLFTSTSTTNDPFLEQPSLSPAQFFQVDYMVASCSGEQTSQADKRQPTVSLSSHKILHKLRIDRIELKVDLRPEMKKHFSIRIQDIQANPMLRMAHPMLRGPLAQGSESPEDMTSYKENSPLTMMRLTNAVVTSPRRSSQSP
ncbi:MAG: hypothetical protein M1833_003847 [Piccolia ochrophora]|nr:MAG: hypothetical protein M1833_003847 [Piccolia ochrophora]